MNPISALRVSLAFTPREDLIVGRLALDRGIGVFEYSRSFLDPGLILNPYWPKPDVGLMRAREPRIFQGLHGTFADSLPDAWGELLLRRRSTQIHIDYASLSSLQKLALIGRRGPGALVYEAAFKTPDVEVVDLDLLAHEVAEVSEGHATEMLALLERLGGSSGGARPKVLVAMNDTGTVMSDSEHLHPGFEAWIVKYRSSADFPDIGPLEATYAEMARSAGLIVAPTKLIRARSGPGYFATKRFDRTPEAGRLHMLSIAGMLDTHWDVPTIDYRGLLSAVRLAARNERDVEMMFRRMVFNVLAYNRDDHLKQHALLMEADGTWRLAPAYDLTFSLGPAGEHYLSIDGAVKDIRRENLLNVARAQGISTKLANATIAQVQESVAGFRTLAQQYDVTQETISQVRRYLERGLTLSKIKGAPKNRRKHPRNA
jgi:serine/threonine-protein kinase HipA